MTVTLDRLVIRDNDTNYQMGPHVPEADETCHNCGTNEHTLFVGTTTDTVVKVGEQPGLKHSWQCGRCFREWTTRIDADRTCPAGFTWCTRHETDGGEEFHGGDYAPVDADRSGPKEDTTEVLVVTPSRLDTDGVEGEPVVFVLPDDFVRSSLSDALGFTPEAARRFALALLDAAGKASGHKPAEDVKPGDRVVVDGIAQTVTFVVVDGYCCGEIGACGGHVQIHTELSEEIDSGTPAIECATGELVALEVTR